MVWFQMEPRKKNMVEILIKFIQINIEYEVYKYYNI